MRVVKRAALVAFWEDHAQAKAPLENWYDTITSRHWNDFSDFKQHYSRSVDAVGGDRFVFNVGAFRLVAKVDFTDHIAFVRFIGTHAAYDRITNIETI